jgi:hypothetical protein
MVRAVYMSIDTIVVVIVISHKIRSGPASPAISVSDRSEILVLSVLGCMH